MKGKGLGICLCSGQNLFPYNSINKTKIAESLTWQRISFTPEVDGGQKHTVFCQGKCTFSFVFIVLIKTNQTLSDQKLHIVNLVFVSLQLWPVKLGFSSPYEGMLVCTLPVFRVHVWLVGFFFLWYYCMTKILLGFKYAFEQSRLHVLVQLSPQTACSAADLF